MDNWKFCGVLCYCVFLPLDFSKIFNISRIKRFFILLKNSRNVNNDNIVIYKLFVERS